MNGRRGGRWGGPAAPIVALVVLLLLPFAPGAVGGGSPHGAFAPVTGAPAGPYGNVATAAPFAARAGYSASQSPSVEDAVAAAGVVPVVVTFQPRTPAFFVPPAPGATPLTTPQIADRFGLSPGQYATFVEYFRSHGLDIVHTWPDRLSLTVSGSAAAVGRAFGTSLEAGQYDGRPVVFPRSPPSLPSSLEPLVSSVLGLSSGFSTFSTPSLGTPRPLGTSVPAAQNPSDLVTPAIARSIYDLSGLYNLSGSARWASSQSIALLLWGPGYSPSDLQTFFAQDYPSGFPSPSIVPEPVDGAPAPSAGAVNDACGASEELTLDLEWSGSMAPGATLYAVYAPEGTAPNCSPTSIAMADALHTAVGLPVDAISMSFGTPESSDAGLQAAWGVYLAEAMQKGITLLAATGDLGGDAAANCTGGPSPTYPATSPDVLAVGGTNVHLVRSLFGVTGYSETAWNDSGGGFSTQFVAPSWQSSTTGNAYRGTPDVSATAALNALYFDGRSMTAAGTSFATPLWAGLLTEMDAVYGQPFGYVTPRLYAIGAAVAAGSAAPGLVDVTSGTTCLGSAAPGWDPETGWGSPSAVALYEDLTATFVDLSLRVVPAAVGPGGTVTIEGHLSNRTTGAPIPGVPVRVSLTSSSTLGPCTGTFGSVAPLTDAAGNVTASVSVPFCYLGSRAVAQLLVASNGYYGVNATTVAVNLLAFAPFLSGLAEYPYSLVGFGVIMGAAATVGYALGRPPRRAVATGAARPPPAEPSGPPPSAPRPPEPTPTTTEPPALVPAEEPPPLAAPPATGGERT